MVTLFELTMYDDKSRPSKTLYRSAATMLEIQREAGKIAKKNQCSVDIALDGKGVWCERYLVTANPCPHSRKGFYIERLDG